MNSVDSDVHVNRLETACASETPDLFLTFTCNQKEHPGVAEVVPGNFRTLRNRYDRRTERGAAVVHGNHC